MTTDTLSQHAMQDSINRARADYMEQYTLWQILGIWALVALPTALLAWVVAPLITPYSPLHPGITFWLLMIAGMVWQFVVSLVIMYRELGTLRSGDHGGAPSASAPGCKPRVIQAQTSRIQSYIGGCCLPCSSLPW